MQTCSESLLMTLFQGDEEDEDNILSGNSENADQAPQANPSPVSTPKRPSEPVSGQSTHIKPSLKRGSVRNSRGASPAAMTKGSIQLFTFHNP